MIGLRSLRKISYKWINFRLAYQSYRFKTDLLRKITEKTIRYSPIALLFSSLFLTCAQEQQETVPQEFEELTMPQLVGYLHQKPSKEFVVVIYDKFKKTNNSKKFAEELKVIVEECKKAKIHTIYTMNSKDADHLRDIVRRLRNEAEGQQQANSKKQDKTFQCYFKSKCYEEAFELLNNRSCKIGDQIKEIRSLEIEVNRTNLVEHLQSHITVPFDLNKTIVVKQCPSEGECVDSFKKQVSKLIQDGMFNWKSQEFQFQLVVDYPTGLLSKSTDYMKNFQNEMQKIIGKQPTKKENLFLLRRDILGKNINIWSSWLQREGLNYDTQDRFMMYLRPRVNIISKYSTFTDVMWYLRTSRLNPQISLSLNNTDIWQKKNSPQSLKILKLFYSHYPRLNYLIFNARSVGEIFHHVYSDHKYVLFQQSHEPVWKKIFLDLDKLQILDDSTKKTMFQSEFKPKINEFIQKPTLSDQVVIDKELEISFDKLKLIKDSQIINNRGGNIQNYILRVCSEKCGRYLRKERLDQIEKILKERLNVYWIDGSSQNVGVQQGDYLLKDGKLVDLESFVSQSHPNQGQ